MQNFSNQYPDSPYSDIFALLHFCNIIGTEYALYSYEVFINYS